MNREKQIDIIEDLLIDFDEMGFAPTTACPDPEAYAKEWKEKLISAFEDYRKQSEGEWESYYDGYRCPCCKEVFKSDMLFIMESFPEGKLSDCCPNCGSKMKGGEQE